MRLTRGVVVLALAAGLAAPEAASAVTRPKPVCNLVTDARGDADGLLSAEPGLDVLSADLASDTRNVTAVIRLAAAPVKAGNPNAPEGGSYYFVFRLPNAKNPIYLSAQGDVTGSYSYVLGDVEPNAGGSIYTPTTGTVKGTIKGAVISLSVTRSTLATLGTLRPGTRVTGLRVETFSPLEAPVVGGGLLLSADEAVSSRAYVGGTPSCVRPGS